MIGPRTLRARLVASYLLVIAAVAGAGFITVRLLTPAIFENRIQARGGAVGGNGPGPGAARESSYAVSSQVEETYEQALTLAAVIATLVGVALALAFAWLLTRRLLRRLDEVQIATEHLAAGDHDVTVPVPDEVELASLATSINSLGATLAATDRTRAQLVSDLAHELRNPLSTIQGYMEGLIDGVIPATPESFSSVADEAHRLNRLTNDLSLLARAQEGALDLELERVDLAELATRVGERLRPQFDAEGIALHLDLTRALEVNGDPQRLAQTITNIVGNALTYTPRGGAVTLTATHDATRCRLDVADTGKGIPPDQLETIFERYTRLDPNGRGIGIGLNIARTIVRAHHGDLTAHSEVGGGTTFTIELPRQG